MPKCRYNSSILCEQRTYNTCKTKCKFIHKNISTQKKTPLAYSLTTTNMKRFIMAYKYCGLCHHFTGSFERCGKTKMVFFTKKVCALISPVNKTDRLEKY